MNKKMHSIMHSLMHPLSQQCRTIAGKTIGELADIAGISVPKTLHRNKGFVGHLIEWHLGAKLGSKPGPDFPDLGIELKTIPLKIDGTPKESTFICTAPSALTPDMVYWETSCVRQKLCKILWVPFEWDFTIPLDKRRILTPFLWTIDPETDSILKQDFEELTEMLYLGQSKQDASIGRYLHIRPKAANSRILRNVLTEEGELVKFCPKGFYLRVSATKKIFTRFK